MLCENAKKVISIEKDEFLFKEAKKNFSKIQNLTIRHGDGFKTKEKFTIFVSNLPYSKSKDAIEWLATIPFSHGVIMVQNEFAEKLLSKSNKKRRAISVVANHVFEIQNILKVGKKNFTPNPKIESVVLKIIKKQSIEKDLIEILNKIFSYRRKKISNILKQFGKETSLEKRLDDLSVEEIVELAKEIRA
jgi:16S rRNA (adenine1518-N6/adenine1519-N6)-dimethyltransferase